MVAGGQHYPLHHFQLEKGPEQEEGPEWEEGRLESGDTGRTVLHRELVLAEGRAEGSQ